MVTSQHEALHRIFRDNPELYSRAFKMLNIEFPAAREVAVIDTDMTEIVPIERRADTVMMFTSRGGAKHVIISESQSEPDNDKPASWAYYISYARIKFDCPATLLVISQKESTAKWARRPKAIGLPGHPSLTVHPIVLGPDNVPKITDLAEASTDVVLTMFSALTHARSSEVAAILEALDVALTTVDTNSARYMAEQVEIGLGDTKARQIWRGLMTMQNYRYKSEFAEILRAEGEAIGEARGKALGEALGEARGKALGKALGEALGEARGKALGKALGEARSVLKILEERGVPVSESVRERIQNCTDPALLDQWLLRSLKVTTAEELFG
ncbi:hypothetical protein ACFOY2_36350 [Nonomuraea purpurea]|uniref:Transposase (putative) YhgA-like domain-containing protein n=1 Tax=Nonomuraea purpurea TaxID=1849276 RepID=A0ABV8GFN2_9ACTN